MPIWHTHYIVNAYTGTLGLTDTVLIKTSWVLGNICTHALSSRLLELKVEMFTPLCSVDNRSEKDASIWPKSY